MDVKRFINSPVSSNTYILQFEKNNDCVIIDPGSKKSEELIDYLKINQLKPKYVFFTHFHFDHVWGIEELLKYYKPIIICSKDCFSRLSKPENYFNLLYYNSSDPFYLNNVDIVIEKEISIIIEDYEMKFIPTPGHTDGCVSLYVDNKLFLGDSLVYGVKPILKKKYGASLEDLKNSLGQLFKRFPSVVVYPGHLEKFDLCAGIKWFEKNVSPIANDKII